MTTAILPQPHATAVTASRRLTTAAPAGSARVALAGSIAAVPPMVMLHLDAPAGLSASRTTISDYVVITPMGEPLFGLATGALALAGLAIAYGLAGSAGARVIRVLLAGWSLALIAAAVFPTNRPGTAGDVSSTIHLVAGAVVFALLPMAGFALWRWRRTAIAASWVGRALLAGSLVSGILSTALILNRAPGVLGLDDLMLPPGLLQRAAGAAEIVLAAVIAMTLLRPTRTAAR